MQRYRWLGISASRLFHVPQLGIKRFQDRDLSSKTLLSRLSSHPQGISIRQFSLRSNNKIKIFGVASKYFKRNVTNAQAPEVNTKNVTSPELVNVTDVGSVHLATIIRMLQAFRHSLKRVEKHYAKTLSLPPDQAVITPTTLPKLIGAISLVTSKHLQQKREYMLKATLEEKQRSARHYADSTGVPLWMIRMFLHLSPIAHASYQLTASDFEKRCERESVRVSVLHAQAYGDIDKRPPFFVVKDEDTKELIVSFRGTQNFEDIITDLISWPVPFLDSYAHHGMSQSATFLLDSLLDAIAQAVEKSWLPRDPSSQDSCNKDLTPQAELYHRLLSSDKEWPRVVFTGHSLGAGVAVCAALLCHTPSLSAPVTEPQNSPASELEAILRRTFANRLAPECTLFAAPACLSPELSLRAATFSKALVLGDDLVPRLSEFSIAQLVLELYETAMAKKAEDESKAGASSSLLVAEGTHLSEAIKSVESLVKLANEPSEAVLKWLNEARGKVQEASDAWKQAEAKIRMNTEANDAENQHAEDKVFKLTETLDQIQRELTSKFLEIKRDSESKTVNSYLDEPHSAVVTSTDRNSANVEKNDSIEKSVSLLLADFKQAVTSHREQHIEQKKELDERIDSAKEQIEQNLKSLLSNPAASKLLSQAKSVFDSIVNSIPSLSPLLPSTLQKIDAEQTVKMVLSAFGFAVDAAKKAVSNAVQNKQEAATADKSREEVPSSTSWWTFSFEGGLLKALSTLDSKIPALEGEKFSEALDLTLLVLPCDVFHIERLVALENAQDEKNSSFSKPNSLSQGPEASGSQSDQPKDGTVLRPVIIGEERFDSFETWLSGLDGEMKSPYIRSSQSPQLLPPIKSLLPAAVNSTIDAIVISPEQQFRIVRKAHFSPFTKIILSENTTWDHAMKRTRLALMNILQHALKEQREFESTQKKTQEEEDNSEQRKNSKC